MRAYQTDFHTNLQLLYVIFLSGFGIYDTPPPSPTTNIFIYLCEYIVKYIVHTKMIIETAF